MVLITKCFVLGEVSGFVFQNRPMEIPSGEHGKEGQKGKTPQQKAAETIGAAEDFLSRLPSASPEIRQEQAKQKIEELYRTGNSMLREGNPEEALLLYERAEQLAYTHGFPPEPGLFYGKGQALYRLEEVNKAREAFEKFLNVAGNDDKYKDLVSIVSNTNLQSKGYY